MRTAKACFVALFLVSASGVVLAHNCPYDMKDIDAKLATKPKLSAADAAKIAKLRAEGEVLHNAGKHDESMKSLGEARIMLGIPRPE